MVRRNYVCQATPLLVTHDNYASLLIVRSIIPRTIIHVNMSARLIRRAYLSIYHATLRELRSKHHAAEKEKCYTILVSWY